MNCEITAQRLREILSYDESKGRFHWVAKPNKSLPAGVMAGGFTGEGYRAIRIDGLLYKEHRLAWLYVHGKWPAGVIDHINGVKSDNRIVNLRDVSIAGNLQNQTKPHSKNTSGYLGVQVWRGRFRASIALDGKKFALGSFDTAAEAHQAYVEKKRELHPTGML